MKGTHECGMRRRSQSTDAGESSTLLFSVGSVNSLAYRGDEGLKVPFLQAQEKIQIEAGAEKLLGDLDEFFFRDISA